MHFLRSLDPGAPRATAPRLALRRARIVVLAAGFASGCGAPPVAASGGSAGGAHVAVPAESRAAPNGNEGCDGPHFERCYASALTRKASGDPRVRAEAAADFMRACEARHAPSCVEAGRALLTGRGVALDSVGAFRRFGQACDLGDMHGCGLFAQWTSNPTLDAPHARALATRACDAGAGEGCTAIGKMIAQKAGKPAPAEVIALYTKGCDLGDAVGCWNAFAVGDGWSTPGAVGIASRACSGGVARACLELASRAANGEGGRGDDAEAARLYERSCDEGGVEGCGWLGTLTMAGRGVPRDQARAASLLARACDNGIARACGELGGAFAGGQGVERDAHHAIELYDRACRAGESSPCSMLVHDYRLYPKGQGDRAPAIALLDAACTAKVAHACVALGSWVRWSAKEPDHLARASALLASGCELGDSDVCATAYATAEGAKLPAPIALLETGCTKGSQTTCVALSKALRDGKGVPRDPARAADLARKACDARASEGCIVAADAYASGAGLPRDLAKAASLRERACDEGWPQACRALATMARGGVGVARDLERAKALDAKAKQMEDD